MEPMPNELDINPMEEIKKGKLVVLDGEVCSWWSDHWRKSNPRLVANESQQQNGNDAEETKINEFPDELTLNGACESSVVQGICPTTCSLFN